MSIIVKLNGGLANQMFQYAFAKAVAKKLNTGFKLDITPFGRYYIHDPYLLPLFKVEPETAKDSDMLGFIWLRKHNSFFEFFYRHLRLKRLFLPFYYREKKFSYDPSVYSHDKNYFDGFWQSEKYFKDIRDELLKDFELKEPLSPHSTDMLKQINESQSVSLHVRRYESEGSTPWHGYCSEEYYRQAVGLIKNKIKNPFFFIFSDNYPWVVENLVPKLKEWDINYTLVNNGNDKNGEDIILMSKCKHNIVANSSFSWWGAWLGTETNRIVIAPSKWFANNKNDISDLIPEKWIKI